MHRLPRSICMSIFIIIPCACLAICIKIASCGPREDWGSFYWLQLIKMQILPQNIFICLYAQVQMVMQLFCSRSKASWCKLVVTWSGTIRTVCCAEPEPQITSRSSVSEQLSATSEHKQSRCTDVCSCPPRHGLEVLLCHFVAVVL